MKTNVPAAEITGTTKINLVQDEAQKILELLTEFCEAQPNCSDVVFKSQ